MDIFSIFTATSNEALIGLFFKVFAVFLSVLYLFYAIILQKQTSVMMKTVSGENHSVIRFVTFIQIILAIILIILSIFFI